jgi:protoporphyrinogen/coproporphyrinogen III oxidase
MTHVDLVVVGGGITGLAAAWEAHQLGASAVVMERDPHVGGKLRT